MQCPIAIFTVILKSTPNARLNGGGYPRFDYPRECHQASKLVHVCDVYDAITSNRPYKKGWDPAESIRRMAEWSRFVLMRSGKTTVAPLLSCGAARDLLRTGIGLVSPRFIAISCQTSKSRARG